MKPINTFLLERGLRLVDNPCVSPDFCLDWAGMQAAIRAGEVKEWRRSGVETAAGVFSLVEAATGDLAWKGEEKGSAGGGSGLAEGMAWGGFRWYPATWENLLRLKNLVLEHDPASTVFPGTGGKLGKSTLGIGARFTTLHWPGVDWAMSALGMGVTANQNSIPRELVYDVEAMLAGSLDTVPFPFIGTNVPEGHQGQSVEGMSHGCVLTKLKNGFHRRRIPWSFNADHQPIGGKFDGREAALVRGCLLASYITFDLSPELSATVIPGTPEERAAWVGREMEAGLVETVRARVGTAGLSLEEDAFLTLLCTVWPAMRKMKRRDMAYRRAREEAFTREEGRGYLRELSIDELPGLTTPETTAVMLALCEALEMPVNFVAPAFGFQKNMPYPDNAGLRALVERQWAVFQKFGVSIGFHSGSGKSAENYAVLGAVTGGQLEIKTSGRYTYEMGVALAGSSDPGDRALFADWYRFTVEMALAGAFSEQETERKMARSFIVDALRKSGRDEAVLADPESCRAAVEALPMSPDAMFWFEYNFLFVLAAGGRAEKAALGDHAEAGYRQRARFYGISPEGRLRFAKGVARYILFLARHTGLAAAEVCDRAEQRLDQLVSMEALGDDIEA